MKTDELSAKASIRVHRPPSVVFDAFADAAQMSKFWFTRRDEGLEAGKPVTWYLGSGKDAMAFEVQVRECRQPETIVIEWDNGDEPTRVTWTFEDAGNDATILTIEETGFTGSADEIVARALDSTGGFNQVLIAAKALVEHGVAMNLVADHA